MKDFTENLISAATGDIVAAAKAMKFITLSPMFFRECLFWEKFIMFMDGVFLEDDDITKLSEIFAGNDEKDLIANIHIEFLKQNGLVIQSEISSYEDISENEYIITPLAIMLDMYGVNYDNGKYKYSILTNNLSEQPVPITRMGKIITRFA